MHYFQKVFEILKEASSLGEERTPEGVILIGKTPHIAPRAWLHYIFPPIDDAEINLLEQEIGRIFPESLREFLELSNGINVFSDSLAIFGHRTTFDRSSTVIEPYSIVSMNLYERPPNLPKNMLLVGSYSCGDGAFLYMDPRSGAVMRSARNDATPTHRWTSFDTMLVDEVSRLAERFDARGRPLVAGRSP
jgi:hypothetical protein